MTIPKLGDLVIFPDKSIGYVYKAESKKINKINHISFEMKLTPDTEHLKRTWLRFYMPAANMSSDFFNGFTAEISNFSIQKFGAKVIIAASHRKFNECCRFSGWEIIRAQATRPVQKAHPTEIDNSSC